jgi:hypothetical protein
LPNGYPGTISGAVIGGLYDFYNTNDFALATGAIAGYPVSWEANQKKYKPDSGWGYLTDGLNLFNTWFKSFFLAICRGWQLPRAEGTKTSAD